MSHGVRCFAKPIIKFSHNKIFNVIPVPTQKMPRLLTTSASACRRLILKAELMGIDADALEFQEAQVNRIVQINATF